MFNIQTLEVKAIIVGVVLLIIVGLSTGLYICHNKYVEALISNGDLKKQNDGYVAKIKADSDAVAKLAAESKNREDSAKAAVIAAQTKARAYQKKADELLVALAKDPNNLCLSADSLFNDYIGGKYHE